MSYLDPRRFREVLGHYPTGVTLVTTRTVDGAPVGMVVGSVTSVSLDPPLVCYLPSKSSYTFSLMRTSDVFCINVLSAEQEGLCRHFAQRRDDKWAGVKWTSSPGGAPLVDGVVAWIECSTESITEAGDHYLVMGRVRALEIARHATPLLFFQGGYGTFTLTSLVPVSSPELARAFHLAEVARTEMDELSFRLGASCDITAPVGEDLTMVGAASASGGRASPTTLGTRIPLIAPLGEQYVAHLDDDAAAQWINRSGLTDEQTRARLLERLSSARRRGWTISTLGADELSDMQEVLQQYSEGALTPAQDRALRARIRSWALQADTTTVVPDERYDLHSIVMPVLGVDKRPIVMVRLASLPQNATGAKVLQWIDELRRTTSALASKLDPARV
jgi:flavin reductase (DIM6/NTAB) family NADH-FMN oxidoreductase RutF